MVADALWLLTARARNSQQWVDNTHCDVHTMHIDDHHYPVTLQNSSQWTTSYVVSARSTWLRYVRHEAMRQLSPRMAAMIRPLSGLLLCPLSALMSASRLDQAAIAANYMISTNLYPAWTQEQVQQITENLSTTYPQRPLMIRNICEAVCPDVFRHLQEEGWEMIPARLIYTCDPQETSVWKHNHVRQDARLLLDPQVEMVTHDAIRREDLAELRQVFRQLFIDKHSYLNPDFSDNFFELCLETRFLEFTALRYQGRWVGILGIYSHPASGWMTTPLIGYDTSLPQELGLYRRLMAILLNNAKSRQLKLHYSSGAGRFKQMRGGQPALEYTAVYARHLPKQTRVALHIFTQLLQKLAPGILKRADKL